MQDWTPQEDVGQLLRQMPEGWTEKVLKAEAKTAERRALGKLAHLDVPAQQLKGALEQSFGPLVAVKRLMGCHEIEFSSKAQLDLAVSFRDLTIGGVHCPIMKTRARWTSEEIFDWVAEQLRVVKESQVLAEGARVRVQEVHDSKSKKHVEDRRTSSWKGSANFKGKSGEGKGWKGGDGKGRKGGDGKGWYGGWKGGWQSGRGRTGPWH